MDHVCQLCRSVRHRRGNQRHAKAFCLVHRIRVRPHARLQGHIGREVQGFALAGVGCIGDQHVATEVEGIGEVAEFLRICRIGLRPGEDQAGERIVLAAVLGQCQACQI